MKKNKPGVNLEKLAEGAFAEKLNEELLKVAANIADPNTDPTTKREITVKLKFAPNKTRQVVNTTITVTSKLAATEAIDTQMMMGVNLRTGEVEVAEIAQMSFNDAEPEEEPAEKQAPEAAGQSADNPVQPQPSGKPLDLRNRTAGQSADNKETTAAQVVVLKPRAAQA